MASPKNKNEGLLRKEIKTLKDDLGSMRCRGLSIDDLRCEGEFLRYVRVLRHFAKRYTVFIVASDTPCGPGFSHEISAELMRVGLKVNLAGMFRHAYAAVIDRGELVYERIAPSVTEIVSHELKIESAHIKLESIGFSAKKKVGASVEIDGENCIKGNRGLNFVVFDIVARNIIDAVNFDTYSDNFTCRRPSAVTDGILAFKNSNPGVAVFCVSFPKFPDSDLTANERFILSRNLRHTAILQNAGNPISELSKRFTTPEEISMVLTPPKSYYGVNGIRRFEDMHSRHVNTSGGIRVTAGQPRDYKRSLYVVGGCGVFGMGASDGGTVPSHLQRLFNELAPEQGVIVHNYGFYLMEADVHTNEELSTLNSLPVKSGDIVLCAFGMDGKLPSMDLRDEAKRPHGYGEVFFDTGHCTENGYRLIADKIFDRLRNEGFLRNAPQAMPNPASLPKGDKGYAGLDSGARKELDEYKKILTDFFRSRLEVTIGSVVMNCNPFTLGHRYLIEKAAGQVDHLIIFVVQEDKSMFPFDDRIKLVDEGTADLKNVTVIPSGRFIISSLTFSGYFNKSEMQDRHVDPSLDIELFAQEIAPCLNISVRFAGEEPLDMVTKRYNDAMRAALPQYGIQFVEMPRMGHEGKPISASLVRQLLGDKNFEEISKLVPGTTLKYLMEKF